MASLVAPLVSGIPGASSGSVVFYQAGTATEATVYSDSEGVGPASSPHTLDANGGIVLYVKERVDVVVYDIDEATVREFTWGTDAREARLENMGFTGPDFSGMILPGGRTTVDAALTSLSESLGTTDGLVMVNGEAVPISTAFNQAAGLVYNVKSGYGALGDGLTNDSPSVQAAINAADAAGGGIIFFPQGTYLLSSAITVASSTGRFTYLGASASSTFLKQGTSGIVMLSLGASNTNLLLGLTFTATAANTGTLVSVGNSGRATFLGCSFEPVNGNQILVGNSKTSVATLLNCRVSQAGASSRAVSGTGGTVRMVASDLLTAGPDMTSIDTLGAVSFDGCTITMGSAIAAGTSQLVANGNITICGGTVQNRYASGTVAIAASGGLSIVGAYIDCQGGSDLSLAVTGVAHEAGCIFSEPWGGLVRVETVNGYSATRDHRVKYTLLTTETAYTPDGNFMIHEVESSGASIVFQNPSPAVPIGSKLVVLYKNTSGGAITPTFGSDYVALTASVDNGKSAIYEFSARLGVLGGNRFISTTPQPAGGTTL